MDKRGGVLFKKYGRKFLEVFAKDGKLKFQEWCKYKDGSFNYR